MSDMGYYVPASSLTRKMPPKYLAAPSLFLPSSIATKIGTAENWPLNGRFMTTHSLSALDLERVAQVESRSDKLQ